MVTLVVIAVSSNKAGPPLAKTTGPPFCTQLLAVIVSQLPLLMPVHLKAVAVMFTWILLPLVVRLPIKPFKTPRLTAGAVPLVQEING